MVEVKLKEIRECWSHLENTTKVKARQLFETQNHRTIDLPTNNLSDLDQHLNVIQEQPPTLSSAQTTQPTLLQPRPTFSQQLQRIQVRPETATKRYFLIWQIAGSFVISLYPHLLVVGSPNAALSWCWRSQGQY